ncbi:hypothetical protein F0919_15140 [Taibaiella lutea]|uniref:MtN3 and saliva related transmembrane protein n=1 Tax=Taibaiella lutea TaxID=2608001 RepID=A0A5M6CAI3_9BACT|nr:SemiSWEET transporter [Taibaiella lutea]KAA5532134.1 hypothetical protein F0919_15140 [Taibaiella lutea]
MNYENIIGLVAGLITSASMLPQLIKVIKEKDASYLSLAMICILIIGLCFWVYYGFLIHELPIILSNGFAVLVNSTLLGCYFLYRSKK